MSLHYLVKYLCSVNHPAQKVIEANCHVRLSNSKNCFKIYAWENIHYLIQFTYKMMFTPAILKIPLSAVHNCCNKEKRWCIKMPYMMAVGQLLMASVCQSQGRSQGGVLGVLGPPNPIPLKIIKDKTCTH